MIQDVLQTFPDIKPGFKTYVHNDQLFIDTSIRPVRTILSIFHAGYTRNDMVQALVSLINRIEEYVEDLKNNTVHHTYRKNNMKVFGIRDPVMLVTLEGSKVVYTELVRIYKSLENLKMSYTNDTYVVECINNIQSSLTKYKTQLDNIHYTFGTII